MSQTLSLPAANAVYDILAAHAGAEDSAGARARFVCCAVEDGITEWRFQGTLGFGGKLRFRRHAAHFYVDCYEEDLTAERRRIIAETNLQLARAL
jgi:hypothetical protein